MLLLLLPPWQLLSKLPIDARLGKLILLGVCFDATDEALTIAAALASRSPFLSPTDRRNEANESKRKFAAVHGLQSDHLALLAAYGQFDHTIGDAKFSYARERFLGSKTLIAIGSLKRQLLETLSMAGLAKPGLQASRIEDEGRRNGGSDGVRLALGSPPPPPPELLCAIFASAMHLAYITGGSVTANHGFSCAISSSALPSAPLHSPPLLPFSLLPSPPSLLSPPLLSHYLMLFPSHRLPCLAGMPSAIPKARAPSHRLRRCTPPQ